MLNDKYFPKDGALLGGSGHMTEMEGYKYPHIQLRNISYSRGSRRLLDSISLEARGGELVAILATNRKYREYLSLRTFNPIMTLAVVPKFTHFFESYFEIIVLG